MVQEIDTKDLHRILAGCMIYRPDRRVLIIKRHPELKVFPGLWTVPSGGMERKDYESRPKDSPDGWFNPIEVALRREIRQESGLEVGVLEYFNNYAFIRPDGIPAFGMHFAAPYLSGEVVLEPGDATEHAWILPEEVSNYEILGNIPQNIIELGKRW